MPNTSKTPFLYFKQHRSSFFSSEDSYVWSSEQIDGLEDLSPTLYTILTQEYQEPFLRMEVIQEQLEKSEQVKQLKRHKKAHVSLEALVSNLELHPAKNVYTSTWYGKALLSWALYNQLRVLIDDYHFTLGIDFQEIFFVPRGEKPPPHFRPEIDICTDDLAEYKKKTERASYQIAKTFFNNFAPALTSKRQTQSSLNKMILDNYFNKFPSTIHHQKDIDYSTPLNQYPFFNSALSAYIDFFLFNNGKQIGPLIFTFTNPVDANELLPFLIYNQRSSPRSSELTFVLKGPQYKDEHERQKVFETILRFIKKSRCTAVVQVVLITKDNLDANLLALRPAVHEKTAPFQPLQQDAGYYLSSAEMLSAVYANTQALSIEPYQWVNTLETWRLQHEKNLKKQAQPGAYIIAQEGETSSDTRQSKTLSPEKLKSKARLSLTYQESVAQNQTVNEQVQETQTVQQVCNQSVACHSTVDSSWYLTVDLQDTCKMLKSFAQKQLPEVSAQEQALKQAGYLTNFYLQHHSRQHFYEQLANNQNFRLRIASTLFGHAYLESNTTIPLPHYGVDTIKEDTAENLVKELESRLDGFFEKEREIELSQVFWLEWRTLKNYNSSPVRNKRSLTIHIPFSRLWPDPKSQSDELAYDPLLHYSTLLKDDDLSKLDNDKKNELIHATERLLKLFQPHPPLSQDAIEDLEKQLLLVIDFCFPTTIYNPLLDLTEPMPYRAEKIEGFKRFIASFPEHNEDNLKIMLQVLLRKHSRGLACLVDLLGFLEERSLWNYFYSIHFQYAVNVSSVEQLFEHFPDSTFLELAARTPVGTPQGWPALTRLTHHLAVYAAQHNIRFQRTEWQDLERLWKRLYAKFMTYTGDQEEEVEKLLTQLVLKLIKEQGLFLAPVTSMQTVFTSLEDLLDHAMARHVLKEQINEIQGLSLLPMDTTYACTWNGFQVVSSEMQIHSKAINPKTKAYSVSKPELLQAIKCHHLGDQRLKVAVFRYLGTQNLREDLAFYRQMYQATLQGLTDSNMIYMTELLCAYYAATFTGESYHHKANRVKLSKKLKLFLHQHPEALPQKSDALDKEVIACTKRFFSKLRRIPTNEQTGVQSLWSIWRGQRVSAFPMSSKPIPEIFLRKFPVKGLSHFLLTQKKQIEKNLSELTDSKQIALAIIHQWGTELTFSKENILLIKSYFSALYPKLDMQTLLRDINKITSCLHAFSTLFNRYPRSLLYLAMRQFLDTGSPIECFFSLVELIAAEATKYPGQKAQDMAIALFFLEFIKRPKLCSELANAKSFVALILEANLRIGSPNNLTLFLNLMETLLTLKNRKKAQQTFTALLPLTCNEEGRSFLKTHAHLTAMQLQKVSQFLKLVKPALALKVLNELYQRNPKQPLTGIIVISL